MEKTMLRLSRLAAGMGLGMILTACGGAGDPNDPNDPADPSSPSEEVAGNEPVKPTQEAATGCVTFQRGVNGTVFDTTIQQASANRNFGATGTISAGTTNATFEQALLWFDLSSIPNPASAVILSATLTLGEDASGAVGKVNVHRISNPSTANCTVPSSCPAAGWSEGTVSWDSFYGCTAGTSPPQNCTGGQYDATTWSSFNSTTSPEPLNIDITALTQAWISGTYPNNGILLDEPLTATKPQATAMPSSETGTRQNRPELVVCYAADAGHTGTALLTGGANSSSPNYQGTLSLGESPGGNFLTSPNYTYHGGVVGATQSK